MSIISNLTPVDFKNLFVRGFAYLPNWDSTVIYNTGNVIYYATSNLFYTCLSNGVLDQLPTNTTYWTPIIANVHDYVLDSDIMEAYAEAAITFNMALFGNDDDVVKAYLYLTAHYLSNDLNANGTNSSPINSINSRSVGNVSESYNVPSWTLDSPIFSFYATTLYGQKYLNMLLPQIVGNVVSVCGGTNP